ncbi:MAG: hypothetical protein FWB72_02650 [Firmicutes bacterium]|nr:hypothetical protein [Bacillota bacterium]
MVKLTYSNQLSSDILFFLLVVLFAVAVVSFLAAAILTILDVYVKRVLDSQSNSRREQAALATKFGLGISVLACIVLVVYLIASAF